MTRESSKQECHRENGQNTCWLSGSRALGRLDVPDFPVSRSQPMNPFTTDAALRILGLPRLCLSQFADLATHSEDEAFMAALLELAFQTRVREARYGQSLQIARALAHEWPEEDWAFWRSEEHTSEL